MLGNPFNGPLVWDNAHVRVRKHWIRDRFFGLFRKVKTAVRPLQEAIDQGYIGSQIAVWNAQTGAYEYKGPGYTLALGQGFLLEAKSNHYTLILRP
jgi:hypothetical protein